MINLIVFDQSCESQIFIPPFKLTFKINKHSFSWTWNRFKNFIIWISIYFSNFHWLFIWSIVNIKSILPVCDLNKKIGNRFMPGKKISFNNSYFNIFKFQNNIMFLISSWYEPLTLCSKLPITFNSQFIIAQIKCILTWIIYSMSKNEI